MPANVNNKRKYYWKGTGNKEESIWERIKAFFPLLFYKPRLS